MGYKKYSDDEEENDDVEEEAEDVDDEEEEVEEEDEEEEEERSRKRKYKGSQFIDDVAEEDDDEDEEEEAPRKRRHRRASAFIDDEVAVASDDEEEEIEGEDDFIQDEGVEMIEEEDRGRKHHRSMLPEDDQQENVEDLEKFIQQRYGRHEYEEFEEAETTDVEQQALLPSVKDPKLWMVKCLPGHEREASICLMQKFMDMDMQGKPLLIKSAIALDHLKGYLYVESEKEAYVREAIRGMRMISQREVKLVPIKEMTDVLSVEKKSVDIDQDTWVRVKNGVYKGDLAKVVDVDHVRQRATIKLIPRVDLQVLALKMNEGLQKGGKDADMKNKPRPAPRFINKQELQDLKISVDTKRDPNHAGEYFEFFGGMQFKDGYLYKGVSLKSIDSNGVVPSFDELQKFQKPTDEGGTDSMGLPTALASKRRGQFVKGDAVIVVQGDLKNLMGYVEKVDEDDVYVRPKDKELKGSTLAFKDRQLCKFFKTGDHVKVVAGTHEGATGMIVRVDLGSVVILSDTTKEDLKVFTANIVESSEVTSGLNKLGDYELHDLVLLDQSTVGVIVRVEKDSCQVLKGTPDRAEVLTVKLRDMRKKLFDRNTNAQDRDSNVISLKDIVRVVEGPFKGREGPVEHINRGILFIHDRHHLENGGFLCVRGMWCVALGGSRNRLDRGGRQAHNNNFNGGFQAPMNYLQSPRRSPHPFHQGPGGHGGSTFGGRQMGRRRDHGLVGTTAKIRTGPFKGYRGRVVDATDHDVRIELESQMKVVTVRRDQLSDAVGSQYHNGGGASYRESPRYGAGSETPLHPSRTPMHPAFMTPMRDPSATPIHDGMRTPMRDRAWNPHTAMNTPLRDSSWDDANPSTWGNSGTPQYQPGTPGGRQYEAPTPGGRGWANTPTGSFSEAGTPSESSGPSYGIPASPYLIGTPGGPPMTPGVASYLPSTPGGQPMTPGTGGLDPTSPALGMGGLEIENKWGLPEIVVTVRKAGEEAQVGVIQEAMPDGTCRIALGSSGEGDMIIATHAELELVVPKKTDRIKIVSGELRRSTGKLIGIDGADGIVKMDDTLDIKILDMSSLGKMAAN